MSRGGDTRERAGFWGNVAVGVLLVVLAWAFQRWQLQPWRVPEPDGERIAWAVGLVGVYLLAVAGGWAWRRRRARPVVVTGDGPPPTLVVHASQTGYAEQLAAQTRVALQAGGVPVRELSIADVDVATLQTARQVLFIASTTGEGDPPDVASAFVRRVMPADTRYPDLRYGVLALGDRDYDNYCAFGREIEHWLHHQGAQPLFDRVDVDNGDAGALRHWQHHLRQLAGGGELPDWETPAYSRWTLRRRVLLNPGSAGGPCFHIELSPPPGAMPDWQAGDIAELGPRNSADDVARCLADWALDGDLRMAHGEGARPLREHLAGCLLPRRGDAASQAFAGTLARDGAAIACAALAPLPHREYSIASLPADGAVHLLVRRMTRADGRAGLGSGWLCEHAIEGAVIDLRLRRNSGFHPPADDRPLLLVGNGTGLAGLRALLKARIAAGHRRNWLLFGERNADRDNFHGAEIDAWQAQGWIERLDRVWSRESAPRAYVQDRLLERADTVRDWVARGAAIYVCGSLQGMAPGVDAVLADVLGGDALEALADAGRYRRDVY